MGLGSVTYLQFHQGSHLFSCSEDGTLCLWKTFTWECLRTFKGHKLVIFFHLFDWLANHFDQSSAIWQLLISYDCQELQNIKLQSPLFSAIMVQCNKYVPWTSSWACSVAQVVKKCGDFEWRFFKLSRISTLRGLVQHNLPNHVLSPFNLHLIN